MGIKLDFLFLTICFPFPRSVNESNQPEHPSIQACLIILTSLKFCSNLVFLFAEPSLNEFFVEFEYYQTQNAVQT